MKRSYLAVLVALAVVLLSAERAEAQRPCVPVCRTGGGGVSAYFVLIEKTGLDLYCGLYAAMQQVKARAQLIKWENAKRSKDNEGVDKEIKALRGQVATKSATLAKTEDEGVKARLSKEIEALKRQIGAKEPERKRLIKMIGPKKFRSRSAAEKFIEKKYAAADKAKEKIEDNERAAAKKKRMQEIEKKRAEQEAAKEGAGT